MQFLNDDGASPQATGAKSTMSTFKHTYCAI